MEWNTGIDAKTITQFARNPAKAIVTFNKIRQTSEVFPPDLLSDERISKQDQESDQTFSAKFQSGLKKY